MQNVPVRAKFLAKLLLFLLIFSLIALAGCFGGGDDTPATTTTQVPPVISIVPPPTAPPTTAPTTRPTSDEPGAPFTITVKPGDTLSGIADQFNTTIEVILELNPDLENPDLIRPGATLNVPAPRVN